MTGHSFRLVLWPRVHFSGGGKRPERLSGAHSPQKKRSGRSSTPLLVHAPVAAVGHL